MISRRRAQTSATPPTTPSAKRTAQGSASVPASGNKMSKELRRLTIDANPSLGGVARSLSMTTESRPRPRRSGMRQEAVRETRQDTQEDTQEGVQEVIQEGIQEGTRQDTRHDTQHNQAQHQLLPDGGVLLTPSPSDSPNSPHVPPANEASTATKTLHERVPSLASTATTTIVQERAPSPASTKIVQQRAPSPAVKQTQAQPHTTKSQSTPSIKSPLVTTKSAGKRTITQYFTAVPAQLKLKLKPKSNKRRKIHDSDLDSPTLTGTQSVPEQPVEAPVPIPTATSAPENTADLVEELEHKTPHLKHEPVATSVVEAVADTQQEKEPDKPHDTHHEQAPVTAEELVKSQVDEKKAAKRERELKRLQIDAKPALIDKRSTRQTTFPPPREVFHVSQDPRPIKRQRTSLSAVAGPSTADEPLSSPAKVPQKVLEEASEDSKASEHLPRIQEVLATAPEPDPLVFSAGTDPKLLASGEVNDQWLTRWLGYVAHITGDEDTSRILNEEDAKELIRPDRSEESDQDRHKRISAELDVVAGWNHVDVPEEAIQSSPELPEPVKAVVKKKKQRFNPKPKGQPYVPKAKRKAMEAKEKKLAAGNVAEPVQAPVPEASKSKQEEAAPTTVSNSEEAVLTPIFKAEDSAPKLTPKKEAEPAPTDWLTDLMNSTETVKPEEERPKKPKKTLEAKGKAKVT